MAEIFRIMEVVIYKHKKGRGLFGIFKNIVGYLYAYLSMKLKLLVLCGEMCQFHQVSGINELLTNHCSLLATTT